jgi:2-oxoisovalerate ferredoxin oxidoreductase alpha subunit
MGNTAAVVGALYAGCESFFGYPITPANEIADAAAELFPRLGRVFLQAESETAAVNMMYGAACAGRRTMTASSGPGISLMTEGISFLAGTELPAVIIDIMRAGPGLGNIGPEQGDYNQVVKGGGHGNYRSIVVAPNSVQEMCDLTFSAFSLASAYRTPAIVLADGVLGQMMEPLRFPATPEPCGPVPAWAVAGTAETRGNFLSSIMLDFDQLEEHNLRLQEKYGRIAGAEQKAEMYLTSDADMILVAYGISSRVARTAVDLGRQCGWRVGLLRPVTLYPFPRAVFRELAARSGRRFMTVEMSNGQLAEDVRLAIECRCPVEVVCRYGGNLFSVDEVLARVAAVMG